MKRNSPQESANQVLGVMSVDDVMRFLLDSVNLPNPVDYPEHRPAFERWLRRWRGLFKYLVEDEGGKKHKVPIPDDQLELLAPILRTTLCRMWGERDTRQRDWYCYRLRDTHRLMVRTLEGWQEDAHWGGYDTPKRLTDYALQDVPEISPFEAAIYWAQMNQKLMLYCEGPTCSAPYFFRSEKGQKYCSPECADPARREAKLKWWNANRKQQNSVR